MAAASSLSFRKPAALDPLEVEGKEEKKALTGTRVPIEYPLEIDVKDLQANGKLYNDRIIRLIKHAFPDRNYDGHYNKKELLARLKRFDPSLEQKDLPYAVILSQGQILTKYKGITATERETGVRRTDDRFFPKFIAGRGGFANVKYCQDLQTGKWLVDKIVLASNKEGEECKIMHKLGRAMREQKYVSMKNNRIQIHTLMDYLPHQDLDVFCKNKNLFPTPTGIVLRIVSNMIKAVKDVFDNGILHRDIKPSNFRINLKTLEVTLIDFNLSKIGHTYSSRSLNGTPGIIAPELIEALKYNKDMDYNENTEIYALGYTIKRVCKYFSKMDAAIAREIMFLIESMTSNHPEKRPSLAGCDRFLDELKEKYLNRVDSKEESATVDCQMTEWRKLDLPSDKAHFLQGFSCKTVRIQSDSSKETSLEELKAHIDLERQLFQYDAQVLSNELPVLAPAPETKEATLPVIPFAARLLEIFEKKEHDFFHLTSDREYFQKFPKLRKTYQDIISLLKDKDSGKSLLDSLKSVLQKKTILTDSLWDKVMDMAHAYSTLEKAWEAFSKWTPQGQYIAVCVCALNAKGVTPENFFERTDFMLRKLDECSSKTVAPTATATSSSSSHMRRVR